MNMPKHMEGIDEADVLSAKTPIAMVNNNQKLLYRGVIVGSVEVTSLSKPPDLPDDLSGMIDMYTAPNEEEWDKMRQECTFYFVLIKSVAHRGSSSIGKSQ